MAYIFIDYILFCPMVYIFIDYILLFLSAIVFFWNLFSLSGLCLLSSFSEISSNPLTTDHNHTVDDLGRSDVTCFSITAPWLDLIPSAPTTLLFQVAVLFSPARLIAKSYLAIKILSTK